MSSAPVALVDVLNSLLEAELNSIFRFMGEGSPYLSRATAEVRKPLQEMVLASRQAAADLVRAIDFVGGVPTPRSRPQPEEQYLAFLSLKFLLPKLVEEKKLLIRRYENALRATSGAPPEVLAVIDEHLSTHRAHLQVLERAAAEVIAASK